MNEPAVSYRVFGLDGEYDRQAMKDLIRRGEATSLSEVAVSGSAGVIAGLLMLFKPKLVANLAGRVKRLPS